MVCPFFSVTVTHLFVTRTFDTALCSSSASNSVMGFRPVSSRRNRTVSYSVFPMAPYHSFLRKSTERSKKN